MFPATRKGDLHACPAHGGGPVQPVPRDVETNGLPQARAGDPAFCLGSADFLVTGAATVTVNSKPAARLSSTTMHGGAVAVGSSDVLIGGPSAGTTLGNPGAGKAACGEAKKTRHIPGSSTQYYGNCALEAWRTVINRERAAEGLPPVTEDELLKRATDLGVAGNDPVHKPWAYGATNEAGQVKVLAEHGIDAETADQDPATIQQHVADGKGVVVTVHPGYYWPDGTEEQKGEDCVHAVSVIGVEYDANGRVVAYIINDSGIGTCGMRVAKSDFERALDPERRSTVTKKRAW
jgi:uncharacterized Zn-binding protein involved in type VI secretion